ncbi:hypothetical protein Fmac_032605 [Flemingia macrophylla]|uniref:Uncharacterized protein n=1 Tax=Flemingia macrophylla TaxID=520843 RepID=A0ABD1L5D3_9FABA
MFEYMDYCVNRKDLTGEDMEKVYSLIAYLKEVNRQAKDELASSEISDLEEKHSLLTHFLKTYYALVPSIQEEKNDLQQKKEKMRKIFTDGIRDGLLKAQKKFRSLNIIKTRSVASIKGIRVQWMFEEVPEFIQLYIGGIISGLLEAKLSFPYLDLSAILNPVFHELGMSKGLHDMFGRPLIRVLNEVNVDIEQQELIRYIYYDGITDGLYEARKSFPSLDIIETRSVALNKIARRSKHLLGEDLVQALPTVVEKVYTDGILGGLVEAKLSFPDLNIMAIVVSVLCRMEIAELVIVDNEPEEFHRKNLALMRENDKEKRPMNVGEASASNHHGSEEEQRNDPQWGELMKEIFYEGLTDGLVQAKNSLPSLDIDKTRSAALNKKIYGDRAAWSLEEPKDEGHPQAPLGMKMYIEGIMNGLLEAKLSFPNLDIWATLNTLQSRRLKGTFLTLSSDLKLDKTEVIPPPCSHDPLLQTSIMMKQQSSKSDEAAEREFPLKLMEEHGALRNKFVQLESENVASNKDSDAARSWKTQSQSDVSNKLDFNSGTKSLIESHAATIGFTSVATFTATSIPP